MRNGAPKFTGNVVPAKMKIDELPKAQTISNITLQYIFYLKIFLITFLRAPQPALTRASSFPPSSQLSQAPSSPLNAPSGSPPSKQSASIPVVPSFDEFDDFPLEDEVLRNLIFS